jgi:hypothetical protein
VHHVGHLPRITNSVTYINMEPFFCVLFDTHCSLHIVEDLSAVLVLRCYVTHVVHEVNTYLSNALFPATKLSFRWYSVTQHAYCKIFGYSHTMNQLIIGHVLIIAFSLKMVQITTP